MLLDFPTGTVTPFASPYATLPAGWVKCDGGLYNGTLDNYAQLFAAIGTKYGGSGSSFNVPNLGQRVVRVGVNGAWQGKSTHSLTTTECGIGIHDHTVTSEAYHYHTVSDKGHNHTVSYDVVYDNDKSGTIAHTVYGLAGSNSTSGYMTNEYSGLGGSSTGDNYGCDDYTGDSTATSSGSAHENRMPFLVVQYLIRL